MQACNNCGKAHGVCPHNVQPLNKPARHPAKEILRFGLRVNTTPERAPHFRSLIVAKPVHVVTAEHQDRADDLLLGSLESDTKQSCESGQDRTAQVTVHGRSVTLKLDKCTQCNVLTFSTYVTFGFCQNSPYNAQWIDDHPTWKNHTSLHHRWPHLSIDILHYRLQHSTFRSWMSHLL